MNAASSRPVPSHVATQAVQAPVRSAAPSGLASTSGEMHRPASGGSEGQVTSASSDASLNRVTVEPDTITEQIHGERISLTEGWSSLHYVDVEIEGLSRPVVVLERNCVVYGQM